MRSVENLIDHSSLSSSILKSWFKKNGGIDLELDIGCGDGWFLVRMATAHPESRFIGLEYVEARARKAVARLELAGVQNAVVVRAEALDFVSHHVPEASISRVHVYFPTPHPTALGLKNLLLDETFFRQLQRVLVYSGCVRWATDDDTVFRRAVASVSDEDWLPIEWTRIDVGQAPDLMVGTPCEHHYGSDAFGLIRAVQMLKK